MASSTAFLFRLVLATAALAFAWQYFNAVAEGDESYARSALLIAPNVIVFERLRSVFTGDRIFKTDPIIPSELQIHPLSSRRLILSRPFLSTVA